MRAFCEDAGLLRPGLTCWSMRLWRGIRLGWCALRFSLRRLLWEEEGCSEDGQLQTPFPHLTLRINTDSAEGLRVVSRFGHGLGNCSLEVAHNLRNGQAGQAELLLHWKQGHATQSVHSGKQRSSLEEAVFLRSLHTVRLRPSVLVCKKRLHCSSETLMRLRVMRSHLSFISTQFLVHSK